jgi:hypothetical protein
VYGTVAGVMKSAAEEAARARDARHSQLQMLGQQVQQAMATTAGAYTRPLSSST